MARYFFDVQDGQPTIDEEGTVLSGSDAVAASAMRTLLDIARHEVIKKHERQLSVSVRNEAGTEVYRTELTIRAGWLVGAA